MDTAKAKNFDFKIISDWQGYNSSRDKTNVAENIMVRGSQNIYKKLSGTLAVRQGQKRQGAANDTASPVYSEYVWNTSWGATYTLVVSNATLYAVIDEVWYVLQTGLTKTRYVFDKWWDNSEQKDKALFVNGTDDMYSWGGGFALISSTTVNTIVLDRTITASFLPASGSVVVNGTTYTYSGSSGSTLTGVSGNPTGEANGSGVLEAVVTDTDTPAADFANDFIKVINNQVYVGSYTSRLCYISDDTDFTDYTVPTPRAPGDPELLTLDATLNGIGVKGGAACISFGTDSWAVINFVDITVGTTLTQQTKVDNRPVAALQAALAHEFIDSTGDNLVYLAKDHQVRMFGNFNNAFVPVYPSVSQEIATELMEKDFTGGALRIIGEFTYVTAPIDGTAYLYQVRQLVDGNGQVVGERLWHSPFVWNLTRVDVIHGIIVGFSNANPQIYELWDTGQWHDDSPSDEPLPYTCIIALSYRGEQRRQGLWSFDKQFTEGYITEGTELFGQINYNYQGATNQQAFPINTIDRPATTFKATDPAVLGSNVLGDEPLGDSLTILTSPQDLIPKFKVINSVAIVNCFEFQPIFYSDQADANWEILATGTNIEVEREQNSTFIINKRR